MLTTTPPSSAHSSQEYRMGRKELLALVSAIMAFTAMGIDVMLSAFDEIRAEFELGVTSTATSRVVTVFFLGLAFGQLFYGPLADRFGRKRALHLGASFYILGAVGCALAPSFDLLLASRFVWGVGAAGARVVATSIVRDRFEGVAMASAMSNVMAVFILVPVVAPSLGAVIIAIAPWRSVFWFCVLFAVAIVIWSARLRETLAPVNRRLLSPTVIAEGYWQVARTPVTFGYTMATVFIQAAFTTYLASAELLTAVVFDREAQFPVIFGAVAVLFGLAAMVNGRIVEELGIDRVVTRAFVALAGLLILLGSVTAIGNGEPNFWLFMPVIGLTLASFMFVMPNLNSAAMEPLGAIAGSGSALTGAVRVAGGAVLGGFFSEQVDDSATPLVIGIASMTVLAGLSVWLVRTGGLRAHLRFTRLIPESS
ncbi:MAG: multidrug effflux MFS transporter [Acidimicrobiales bacterium]|nr:multidrug effflux MFS transporter [Acidimicrobiales bacterium]